jgi:RimJ/RimL family protein N-acetyltransferase
MFFRSERLFLRPGWPEDWEEVLTRIADEGVVRNLATAPWPYTAEDAKSFAQRPQDARLPHFVVTLPTADGAKLIGSAGISRDPGTAEDVELGYWIARDHWGQGYATEAARALVCLARALGHRRLVADHFVDNPASGRVLRKAGFRSTGRTRMRHSSGRGGEAPTLCYEHELDCVSGDGNDDMKHAA